MSHHLIPISFSFYILCRSTLVSTTESFRNNNGHIVPEFEIIDRNKSNVSTGQTVPSTRSELYLTPRTLSFNGFSLYKKLFAYVKKQPVVYIPHLRNREGRSWA